MSNQSEGDERRIRDLEERVRALEAAHVPAVEPTLDLDLDLHEKGLSKRLESCKSVAILAALLMAFSRKIDVEGGVGFLLDIVGLAALALAIVCAVLITLVTGWAQTQFWRDRQRGLGSGKKRHFDSALAYADFLDDVAKKLGVWVYVLGGIGFIAVVLAAALAR
ncbi:MAG: hypothetical protein ACE37K_15645 [Planctomycetota bacterium]